MKYKFFFILLFLCSFWSLIKPFDLFSQDFSFDNLKLEFAQCILGSKKNNTSVNSLALSYCRALGVNENLELGKNFTPSFPIINKIQKSTLDEMLNKTTEIAFRESILASFLVLEPFPQTEKQALSEVCKSASTLCKQETFKKIVSQTYKEFLDKKKNLISLSSKKIIEKAKNEMTLLMQSINEKCLSYRKEVMSREKQYKYHEPKTFNKNFISQDNTRVDNTKIKIQLNQFAHEKDSKNWYEKLYKDYKKLLFLDLGYLFITEKFKGENGIGILNEEIFVNKCSYGNGKVFNKMPSDEDLFQAMNEFKGLVFSELKKINDDFVRFKNKNTSRSFKDEYFKQKLKTSPLTILKLLEENPKKEFAKALCHYILEIEDEENRREIANYILTGVGFVAGIALSFTGIGSPLGATLLTTSVALNTTQAALIIDEKLEHKKQALNIKTSAATSQINIDEAIEKEALENEASSGMAIEVLLTVGPDIVGFGAGKLLQKGKSVLNSSTKVEKNLSKASDLKSVKKIGDYSLSHEGKVYDSQYYNSLFEQKFLNFSEKIYAKESKRLDDFFYSQAPEAQITKKHLTMVNEKLQDIVIDYLSDPRSDFDEVFNLVRRKNCFQSVNPKQCFEEYEEALEKIVSKDLSKEPEKPFFKPKLDNDTNLNIYGNNYIIPDSKGTPLNKVAAKVEKDNVKMVSSNNLGSAAGVYVHDEQKIYLNSDLIRSGSSPHALHEYRHMKSDLDLKNLKKESIFRINIKLDESNLNAEKIKLAKLNSGKSTYEAFHMSTDEFYAYSKSLNHAIQNRRDILKKFETKNTIELQELGEGIQGISFITKMLKNLSQHTQENMSLVMNKLSNLAQSNDINLMSHFVDELKKNAYNPKVNGKNIEGIKFYVIKLDNAYQVEVPIFDKNLSTNPKELIELLSKKVTTLDKVSKDLYSDVDELEKFFDILKQKQEVTKEEFIELTNKVSKINKSLKPYD